MKKPKTAILYARHSPRPDVPDDELDSTAKQVELLRAEADRLGWQTSAKLTFRDEDKSGNNSRRVGLGKALEALRPGMVLMVRDFQRIARDSAIMAFVVSKVHSKGAEIHSLENGTVKADDPASKLLAAIFAAIGQFEREITAGRSRAAWARKLDQGIYRGQVVPFGYRWLDQAAGRVEPIPEEQAIIEEIKDLQESGVSSRLIAEALNQSGKLRRGEPWDRHQVRRVVDKWRPKRPKKHRLG